MGANRANPAGPVSGEAGGSSARPLPGGSGVHVPEHSNGRASSSTPKHSVAYMVGSILSQSAIRIHRDLLKAVALVGCVFW